MTPSPSLPAPLPRAHRWCAAAALLFTALATLRPVGDPDLPWHLAAGRWIVANGRVPRTDPFSFTYFGAPWRLVDWGSQLVLYGLHQAGGLPALLLFGSVLAALALAVAAARMARARAHPSALLLTSALLALYGASAFRFSVRPQTVLFPLLGGLFLLFERASEAPRREAPRRPWSVPFLLALWANLHGSSTVGLSFCAVYGLGRWLGRARYGLGASAWRALGGWALWGLACGAGALAQPNPRGQLSVVFEAAGSSYVHQVITEWQRTPLSFWLGPAGVLVAACALGFALDRKATPLWEPLCAAYALWLGARHVRFVPVTAVVLAPLAYRHLAAALERAPRWTPRARSLDPAAAGLLLLAAFGVAFGAEHPTRWLGDARRPVVTWDPSIYVDGAAAYLRRARVPGPRFNSFLFGGYLVWALYPERVFIDGRTSNVYPESFLAEVARTTGHNFERLRARYGFESAVVTHDDIARALGRDPAWALVYFDDHALVYARRGGAADAVAQRDGYQLLTPDGVPDARALHNDALRARWEQEVQRAVREAPRSGLARFQLGALLAAEGDPEAADGAFARALELQPRLLQALLARARLALQRGDLPRAVPLFERLVEEGGARGPGVSLLALAYSALGRREEALALLRRAEGVQDAERRLAELRASPLGRRLVARPSP